MLRFLIADDSTPTRQILRELIESHHAWRVVAEAADGLEAVKQAADHHLHVALLDVVMPRLDGIRAARRIKTLAPATHVIVFTAHHNSAFRRRALAAGADAFFFKEELDRPALEVLVQRWFPDEPGE